MTIPVWVLLLFAAWTVVLLAGTVGYFRWSSHTCWPRHNPGMATGRRPRDGLV